MPIPANAQNIYEFLTGHGYTPNAAAGIVGNVEQESGGNPATPGGGLIQILPGGPGYTTNTSLAAQEQSILTYDNAQGASLIAQLNAQADAAAAALFYSNKFERPLASAANNSNRQASAMAVANAAKTGNWSAGSGAAGGGNAQTAGIFGLPNPADWAASLGQDIVTAPVKRLWNWFLDSLGLASFTDMLERGALILFGAVLVIVGIHSMMANSSGSKKDTANQALGVAQSAGAGSAASEAEVAAVVV